jgi:hypothetical protein
MLKAHLTALGFVLLASAGPVTPASDFLPLTDASITIEYNATQNSSALVIEAENDDALAKFQLLAPDGSKLLNLAAAPGQRLLLSGLRLESDEPQLDELLQTFPEGEYQLRAAGAGGQWFLGRATLTHTLVRPPAVSFPRDGSIGVSTTGLTLSWTGDAVASGYEIVLEQNENDGIRIKLPPGSTSLVVPDGWLAPATPTQFEIAAVATNGNRSLTSIQFTTQ